ncbi:hypothetical protein UPYG_G00074800 [Umbra pygmaea]|uniref:Uncharacterized protein n=1 Tax=Umbra pygmaea TaxID=75934 RepID=A0ABD0XS59_UMBPY
MLSSTLVSVLAPQWSSRQRRNKRSITSLDMGEPVQETQENSQEYRKGLLKLQYPPRSSSVGQQTMQNQGVGERGLTLGLQAHDRSSGRLGLSSQINVRGGMSQAHRHGDQLSLLSSKPATGLLARKPHNSSWMSARPFSVSSPSSPDVSPTATNYSTSERINASERISFTSSNDRDRERSMSFPDSHTPTTYRTTSSDKDADSHRTHPCATSPCYKGSEDTPITTLPHKSRVYPSLTFPSKETLLYNSVERLCTSDRSDGNNDTKLLSPPPSPYDRLDFLRNQSLPRGTTLCSTSWRRLNILGESGSNSNPPLSPTSTNANNNCNDNTGPLSSNNYNPEITNKNFSQSFTTNNANLNCQQVTRDQTPQGILMKGYTQVAPDNESARSLKTQYALNLNDRQPHKLDSLSNMCFSSNSPVSSNTFSSPITTSKPDGHNTTSRCDTTSPTLSIFSPNSPLAPNSPETSNTLSSLSNTSSSNQSHKTTTKFPLWQRSPPSPKIHLKINSPTSPTSRQLSGQTSSSPTSLSKHRPIYTSHPFDPTRPMTQDPDTTLKSPVTKSHIPTVSKTHTFTSELQSSKTDSTPTSTTTLHPFKTIFPNPTPYTRSGFLGERTFTGRLATTPNRQQPLVEGMSAAQKPCQEPQHYEETSRKQSASHSAQSPADRTGPLSPTRPCHSVEGPAIFSSLRSGSSMSPLSPIISRTTKLQIWRGESLHNLSKISDTVKGEGKAISHDSDHTTRFTFDLTATDSSALGPQRKTAAPLSLPDCGSSYKPRFSSPPYTSLKSSRPTHCEFTHKASPQVPLTPPTSPERYPFYSHHKAKSQDSSNIVAVETDSVMNNALQTSEESVETLVYRISPVDSSWMILDSIRPAQSHLPRHTKDPQVITDIKSDCSRSSKQNLVNGSPSYPSNQSSNDTGSVDPVCKIESEVGFSEAQSPKKGFFSLRSKKENVGGTAAASVLKTPTTLPSEEPKPETEKGQKGSNRMDLVLSRIRQKFRVKRPDDERKKRTSPPPCVSEASDISDVSASSNSIKQAEEKREIWRENEHVLKPSNSVCSGVDDASDRNKCSQFEGFKDKRDAKNREQTKVTNPKRQTSVSEISPTRRQFDPYKEESIRRARNQAPQSGVRPTRHPHWDPSRSATLPAYRSSSASPRNTSVFRFSQEDSDNDNVFFSPRPSQRTKTTSLCEPRDSAFGSWADLKYGLEAGRSFSVTSVLSSRPSGPGRISQGSSLSDLSDPTLPFEGEDVTRGNLRVKGDWTIPTLDSNPCPKSTGDSQANRSKSKSRNVSWSSDVTVLSPKRVTGLSPETSHFRWDTEGPLTPPPSPPWSPASRLISRSLSSSSASPSPSDRRVSPDRLSPRGHLPSRGYVSSLAAFKEADSGPDMDSDSTTDDEYYLAGDRGEKETEL